MNTPSPSRPRRKSGVAKARELVQEQAIERLTKPARIGNTIFGVGVETRLVIDRAYREHEYQEAEKDAAPWEKKDRLGEFVEAVNAPRSESGEPVPDSIVTTYQRKIERDAETIKAMRLKLIELCDRLNWKGPGRESNLEITVREARKLVADHDRIAAGVAFITDTRLGGP